MKQDANSKMTIFLAEDNPADVYLLRVALDEVDQESVTLIVAQDGEEALDFIEGRGRFDDVLRPDLIILDLNLPKTDGNDVLRAIRQAERFNNIPVIVLTSSDSPRDREAAAQLGANEYLTKPTDLDAFLGLGGLLLGFAARQAKANCAA